MPVSVTGRNRDDIWCIPSRRRVAIHYGYGVHDQHLRCGDPPADEGPGGPGRTVQEHGPRGHKGQRPGVGAALHRRHQRGTHTKRPHHKTSHY